MKKLFLALFTVVFILVPFVSNSQARRGANWVFGDSIRMDFNSGQPVVSFGATHKPNGVFPATISDTNGKLLFYTDGINLYNNQYSIVPLPEEFLLSKNRINPSINPNARGNILAAIVPYLNNDYYLILGGSLSNINTFRSTIYFIKFNFSNERFFFIPTNIM